MRVHSLIIEILPLSDLHVGDASFDRECFLRYIRYVEESPNRYILLNGDILNNATKSSVSDIYSDNALPGQGENTGDKEVGISPVEILRCC